MSEEVAHAPPPTPTWLIGGKPGLILALVAQAAVEAGIVKQATARDVGDHYDIGSMERAARAWPRLGIVAIPEVHDEFIGSNYKSSKGTVMTPCVVKYTLVLVAPDGSSIKAVGVGAATSHGGRHIAMARTDARKECIRGLLCMASKESDEVQAKKERQEQAEQDAAEQARIKAAESMTADLRAVIACIDACQDMEELKLVGKHEAQARLLIEEREQARWEWKRRQDDLATLDVRGYVRGKR